MVHFLPSRHRIDVLSATLIAIVLARAFFTCFASPIVAYANNYDFVRQSSCVGVWQDYGGKEKTLNNPERPVNSLVVDGDVRREVCMRSSDNAVPWVVARVVGRGAHIGLRVIGGLKLLMLSGLLAVVLLQPIEPVLRLALSITALLLFGDIAVLAYFDTLYLDASAIMFCFTSIALATTAWCRQRPPGAASLAIFLAVLGWFTCTKQQYAPYAALVGMVGVAGFLLRWKNKRLAGIGLAGVLLIQVFFFGVFTSSNEHTRQIQKANLSDTFLEAVLPAAPDKPRALSILGLPQTCLPAIGLNWYEPRVQHGELCPEIFHTHRSDLLRLFLSYPQTLFQPLLHAAMYNRPFLLPTIGHFENPTDTTRLRYKLLAATSLSNWLEAISATPYLILVIVLSLSGPIGLSLAVRRAVKNHVFGTAGAAELLIGLNGVLSFYVVGSAVFGDGYGDLQRHCVGILIATSFALGAAALAFDTKRTRKEPRLVSKAHSVA